MVSAYKKNYSGHVTHPAKEWREDLNENLVVGVVLTDLSGASVWMAHDLLIANLVAYDFSDTALCFICSCLKHWKCAGINKIIDTVIIRL